MIRVEAAGVNPIDHFVVSGTRPIKPIPHIPGAETSGVIEEAGLHVTSLDKGDRVIVYNKAFDGICDMCLSGNDMLCRNGGLIGVATNGGFAEYITVPEKNVFKIPDEMQWELAGKSTCNHLNTLSCIKRSCIKSK